MHNLNLYYPAGTLYVYNPTQSVGIILSKDKQMYQTLEPETGVFNLSSFTIYYTILFVPNE